MSEEPPAKQQKLDDSVDDRSSSKARQESNGSGTNDNPQSNYAALSSYKGDCRAYGGSHLPAIEPMLDSYHLLDEVNGDDDEEDDGDDTSSELSYGSSQESGDIAEDEIDALLEAGLPLQADDRNTPETPDIALAASENLSGAGVHAEKEATGDVVATAGDATKTNAENEKPIEITKFVLADTDRLHNHYDQLPAGWIEVRHHSGIFVYLHRATRVCTLGRPYKVEQSMTKRHSVPQAAIPCLHYRRMKEQKRLEAEEKLAKAALNTANSSTTPTVGSSLAIDTVNEGTASPNSGRSDALNSKDATKTNSKSSVEGCPDGSDNKSDETNATDGVIPKDSSVVNTEDETANKTSAPPSSTFNTALAKALNIHPNKPPPSGALLTGDAEVRLEQPQQRTLNKDEIFEYCTKVFDFKKIKFQKHTSWRNRRELHKSARRRKREEESPQDTIELLSVIRGSNSDDGIAGKRRKWMLNPRGKSSVCIMHEYVQCVLKEKPIYVFKEMDNSLTPYAATVSIKDMHYATGYGSSKRLAKADAADKTLQILMPELGRKLIESKDADLDTDLSFFDSISIEDPNVLELCTKMSELPPYSILLNCLRKNYCQDSNSINCQLITNINQKNEFEMTVGKHTVRVPCKNKKEGKQKASQALLQKLHPQITAWSSMLRLYGNKSLQQQRQKKLEEQEVTLLQNNAAANQPNHSIINMLQQEMRRLHGPKLRQEPLRRFHLPEDVARPTLSSTDLNTLDI